MTLRVVDSLGDLPVLSFDPVPASKCWRPGGMILHFGAAAVTVNQYLKPGTQGTNATSTGTIADAEFQLPRGGALLNLCAASDTAGTATVFVDGSAVGLARASGGTGLSNRFTNYDTPIILPAACRVTVRITGGGGKWDVSFEFV